LYIYTAAFFVALIIIGIEIFIYKLHKQTSYTAGMLVMALGASPVISYNIDPSSWISPGGGPGGIVGTAIALIFGSSIFLGGVLFFAYIIYRKKRGQVNKNGLSRHSS
jgi:hypothetical protein